MIKQLPYELWIKILKYKTKFLFKQKIKLLESNLKMYQIIKFFDDVDGELFNEVLVFKIKNDDEYEDDRYLKSVELNSYPDFRDDVSYFTLRELPDSFGLTNENDMYIWSDNEETEHFIEFFKCNKKLT